MKKATGMVRRVDDLGRLVLPKELRRTFGIDNGDPVEIFTTTDEIVLRKYQPAGGCSLCWSIASAYVELGWDKRVCAKCGQRSWERLKAGERR